MDKKIKVMHILSRMDTGGLENGVVNICNNLDRAKFQASICCLKGLGPMAFRLKPDVETYNLKFAEGKDFLRPLKVAGFLKKIRPDIVHAHAWGQGSFEVILGAALAGVPVIINGEHGDFFNKRYQIVVQRLLAKLCKITLSVSESLKQQVHSVLGIPLNAMQVIVNGVDTGRFTGSHPVSGLVQELRTTYNFPVHPDDFIIACIGSLKPQKNQELLIRAVSILANERSDVGREIKVLFVGVGPDQERLTKLARDLKVLPQIVFMGNRNDTEVVLSLAQVLVSCSRGNKEGLSNVILEAMASGITVVAVNNIGMDEVISSGVNGYLLTDAHEVPLSRVLNDIMVQKEIVDRIGQKNRMDALRNFSLSGMVKQYERVYDQLIK